MLAEALQAEVDAYIARHTGHRDEHGRRPVVRNGSHQPREVLTSAGAVEVRVPRVNDKRTDPDAGQRRRFCSAILSPWCRKTPKITEVLPLLYLHGLSSGCVRRVLTVTGLDARLLMAAPVEDAVDAVAAEVAGAAERPESVRPSGRWARAAPRPAGTRR